MLPPEDFYILGPPKSTSGRPERTVSRLSEKLNLQMPRVSAIPLALGKANSEAESPKCGHLGPAVSFHVLYCNVTVRCSSRYVVFGHLGNVPRSPPIHSNLAAWIFFRVCGVWGVEFLIQCLEK